MVKTSVKLVSLTENRHQPSLRSLRYIYVGCSEKSVEESDKD